MKCEGFSMVIDFVDYLNNNLLTARYCGFDISLPIPSYWTFDRFLKTFNHDMLSGIMRSQALFLVNKGIVDTSFIGLDSTPVSANTSQNNPKSFLSNLLLQTLIHLPASVCWQLQWLQSLHAPDNLTASWNLSNAPPDTYELNIACSS